MFCYLVDKQVFIKGNVFGTLVFCILSRSLQFLLHVH